MAKLIYKGYKDYLYTDDLTSEVMGRMLLATLCSLISLMTMPPLGVVLSIITIPTTIITGVIMGTNLAVNRNHSRKLFEAINKGDISEIEERLNKISKKFDSNKKYILNGVRDKNGDTLIASIIKSKKITEEKKKELIGKMIDNGANIYKENVDGGIPIEIAKENGAEPELLEFLAEKTEAKLDSREAKYNRILKVINKELENSEKEISNIEAEIKKREEKVKSGFHPFKKRTIRILKEELERLKEERKRLKGLIDTMNSKMEEKVTNKRTTLNRIFNLNGNEEFVDEQMQMNKKY